MTKVQGLRERKKAQQRELIADTAAALFGERGFDAVSMADVARASNVSDQTVYNYFPTKPDLVLDRADDYRERYARAVRERSDDQSPAEALGPLVSIDVDIYLGEDPALAKGEFPALCLQSAGLRRFALELREQQGEELADALAETDPGIPGIVARVHAAALVSVIQSVTDAIGRAVIDGSPAREAAPRMTHDSAIALGHLDRAFRLLRPPR
ncbi:TetR family transcriptional regulator [Frondihabitans sucicola]|uniref:TetR family transcriptional regulator n=1 Tax=Frondihabitans sucicola TaxID=1268041 RepID=A0ABN6Y803_9MICO|nr:TetR/AcrR family transcriptional regulator [Frondihabitans sucicola]BDZ47804.1 TetR family transcriptional regulator [Frondihabitans sucicola]BDZ52277.1 TetR family transcriptional regulator [Frondihabitans sucicola]